MNITIISQWDHCGQSSTEYDLFPKLNIKCGDITTITGDILNQIWKSKDIKGVKAEKNYKFNIYYNCHHCSGHKTYIYCDNYGKVGFKIEEPEGGVLQAFWTEVIIFNYTRIDY
jgi:hypothetical protein